MRLSELTNRQIREGVPENLLGRAALCIYEACAKRMEIDDVAAQRFPNSESAWTITKALQDPATTHVPGYAQQLARQAYGALLDQLRAEAILPRCAPLAQSHTFDGASSIYLPQRVGSPTDVAGGFRQEGGPIAVRGMMFGHQLLTPKNLSVILTATGEMFRRSSLDLAAHFENEIRKDTATALDQHFVSDSPASPIAPAGARAALDPADTRASTGASAAQITADLKAMVSALTDAGMGNAQTTRWLMHPKNAFALSTLLTTGAALQFPEAASQGRIGSYGLVQSTTMDPAIILLIDFSAFTFAMGNPAIEPTQMATIHEESETPLPISTPGEPDPEVDPATVAAPLRSYFQTYSMAIRFVADVDWLKLREHAVQELHSISWA